MYQFILLIHVFAAVLIIALVLLQQGKGATIGAAFGSGASQTIFGSRGSGSFLFRLTLGLITVFFITSISLNYLVAHTLKQPTVLNFPIKPTTNKIVQQPGPKQQVPDIKNAPATGPSNGSKDKLLSNEIPTRN